MTTHDDTQDTQSAAALGLPFARSGRCCSDYKLDQLVLGELDDDESASLKAHLASSPVCLARHDEIVRDRDAFRASPPALDLDRAERGASTTLSASPANSAATATATATATAPARRSDGDGGWSSFRAPILAVAAAAAITIIVPLSSLTSDAGPANFVEVNPDEAPVDVVRAKGNAPSLTVFVKSAAESSVRELASGSIDGVVHPGDALRFAVKTSAPLFVGVVGVDGAGSASIYAAFTNVDAGAHELAGAVQLDEVLGHERYIAFACSTLPADNDVLGAVARSDRPDLPGCALDVVSAKKVNR